MGLALNEDREWRLEVVGYEKKEGEREREKERGEEGEDDERERGGVGEREGGGSLEVGEVKKSREDEERRVAIDS